MTKIKNFQSVKGMHDILPDMQPYWQQLISVFSELADLSGYYKIDTPIVEPAELFIRTSGETSDVVAKEMFYLAEGEDKKQYVLRPEFTAPIARSYLQHGLKTLPKPIKLYSYGPLFRYNQPQAGRVRQLHQLDLEQIGTRSPSADAEIMSLVWDFFNRLGLENISFQINTLGSADSRKNITKLLVNYFSFHQKNLCPDCRQRLQKNPLRILDCKNEKCQEIIADAPQFIDHIDKDAKKDFYELLEYLDELAIPYILNPKLVRGLDYYHKTVFEVFAEGDELALGGGGRYDGLMQLLGGEQTAAVGIGLGMERIIMTMARQKIQFPDPAIKPDIFLIQLGSAAKRKCFNLLHQLRLAGLKVSSSLNKKSISSQLKSADKQQARYSIIIGQKEAIDQTLIIRDMKTGVQDVIEWDKAIREISQRLGK